jgi:hypothetical protein|nr:MAG TPA: hypothetical protein [Caudoviricetes sp.]
MYKYQNGNALISIEKDGTRIIEFKDKLQLKYPLNVDIRVSTQCSFGQKSDGSHGVCAFCHESAKVNGTECNYEELKSKLEDLPQGIELAIGCNNMTVGLKNFIIWCSFNKKYICNVTINQGHISKNWGLIETLINQGYIKGLGISYRSFLKWSVPQSILDYQNTIFHIIAGIDDIDDVKELANKGVRKILILGEKDFGYNKGKVDLNSRKHKHWRWFLPDLFNMFEVVSFDNLALEQLKPERFLSKSDFETFNQGEHSLYINAVDGYYAPSSRSSENVNWNDISLTDYFKQLEKNRNI